MEAVFRPLFYSTYLHRQGSKRLVIKHRSVKPHSKSSYITIDTMSDALTYIAKRPASKASPADIVEYTLPLHSPPATLPFPTPETLWEARDVSREDWGIFQEQLGLHEPATDAKKAENVAARQRRVKYAVEEWNAEFFAPRGLRVRPVFSKDEEKGSVSGSPKGFGFKAGNAFIGVSVSKAGGYGLKLPGGILLGVTTGKDKEEGGSK